ncbi:MAG: hypothetical protein ACLVDB_07130 [Anaeromassilibacillus sp.]
MAYEIRISVKKLAEFLLQSGSLDNRFGGIDRASEGARIHRRLQRREDRRTAQRCSFPSRRSAMDFSIGWREGPTA